MFEATWKEESEVFETRAHVVCYDYAFLHHAPAALHKNRNSFGVSCGANRDGSAGPTSAGYYDQTEEVIKKLLAEAS